MELANIAGNMNTVPGDKSALVPGGLRVGTPAMTSRGFDEKDFEKVASFIDRGVKIAHEVNTKAGGLCLSPVLWLSVLENDCFFFFFQLAAN